MNSSRRFAALFLLLLLGPLSGAAAPPAARAAVVERFAADPLAAQGTNPFFLEGDVPDHFVFLPDEPAHFPGDREGTLRVLYDTTVPAARIATPLGRVLSLDDDFGFGAVLTIRSEGYEASPDGFDQIAFGLWNSSTTGLDRTGFPSDSFDLVELDYFANVNPVFGGPFLSPTVFGGNVGGNAFFNFTFQSTEVRLPFDVPLLVRVEYGAAARRLGVTVSRLGRGLFFEAIPGAAVTVDLSTIRPTFLVRRRRPQAPPRAGRGRRCPPRRGGAADPGRRKPDRPRLDHRQPRSRRRCTMNRPTLPPRVLAPVAMIAAAAAARLLPHPPNVTPLAAIALFAGACLPRRLALVIPLAALFLSDLVIGLHDQMPVVYGSFALIVLLGRLLRARRRALPIAAATLCGSIFFFAATNFGVWAFGSLYPRTFEGLLACYVAALPFFGGTLLGDAFFSAALFGGLALAGRIAPAQRTGARETSV